MRGVVKRFGPVVANNHIDLRVDVGEVVALLGENGAGKSTLMKILYGLYQPDEGEIYRDGQRVTFKSPADAIACGIGMVSQHFSLVARFTVAENIALGREGSFHLNRAAAQTAVQAAARRYNLDVNPAAVVGSLSVGEQQRVEILKALYRDARVLILDEPTAVLTPQEATALFGVLKSLVAQGLAVIFISHKLDEVLAVADRVIVLRDGANVGSMPTAGTSPASLAERMVGRPTFGVKRSGPGEIGAPVLELRALEAANDRGLPALRGVSLQVNAGEVLGLAGVAGNGQTELAEVLSGIRRLQRGTILVEGHALDHADAAQVAAAGIGRIPEDRYKGVVGDLSVAENLALEHLADFMHNGLLDWRTIYAQAERLIREYNIKATPGARARTLSGGNLQKVILARVLSRQPCLVLAAQPTRGLDVSATEYVRGQLLEQRRRGAGVLLISEDLDEILALSDRIAVMFAGRIVGCIPAGQATAERLGLMMAGREMEHG
jgi:simple sugar transport system ATP-binding protein